MDSAVIKLSDATAAFTTDSYVVSPIFFPGGDLGRLAVFGTCNDLAMVGARPVALSLALIIEEGFELDALERVVSAIADACRQVGVEVVTGDTKVVARGQADGMYVNTAGVGVPNSCASLAFERIAAGDKIVINGPIGDHGLAIMARREGLEFETQIVSDVASLVDMVGELIDELGAAVKFLRDPTRGGLAGVLVDIADGANVGIVVDESKIPMNPSTLAAAEILGLDLMTVANEGKLVAVVDPDHADRAVQICQGHDNAHAAIIGEVTEVKVERPARVVLVTRIGGKRIVQKPYGEQLPRIC